MVLIQGSRFGTQGYGAGRVWSQGLGLSLCWFMVQGC